MNDLSFQLGLDWARKLDGEDPLAPYREHFYLPPGKIYLDGNSLGLLSREAEACLLQVLEEWKNLAIDGWLKANPPWFQLAEELGATLAPLVGAEPDEVIVTGSTTTNLHSLLSTFFRPQGQRQKVLCDELNFPSDRYALVSHLKLRGFDPSENLVEVKSNDGRTIAEDDVIAAMADDVALILLPSVLYRSGQLLDMERLTKEAHSRDILVGFDCSHSVGCVDHYFSSWGIDFAFWCNYKYMNNGPGGSATIYVNRRHLGSSPGLAGWWGYRKDKQFDMAPHFEPAATAGAWQIGTPHLLSMAPLRGSLQLFTQAGIKQVRTKSLHLTSYLMYLVDQLLSREPYSFKIATPRDPNRRGGHVALEHPEAVRINAALKNRGIIPDFRPPKVIRLAPVAFYTSFSEIWQTAEHLQAIIDQKEYCQFTSQRDPIA